MGKLGPLLTGAVTTQEVPHPRIMSLSHSPAHVAATHMLWKQVFKRHLCKNTHHRERIEAAPTRSNGTEMEWTCSTVQHGESRKHPASEGREYAPHRKCLEQAEPRRHKDWRLPEAKGRRCGQWLLNTVGSATCWSWWSWCTTNTLYSALCTLKHRSFTLIRKLAAAVV